MVIIREHALQLDETKESLRTFISYVLEKPINIDLINSKRAQVVHRAASFKNEALSSSPISSSKNVVITAPMPVSNLDIPSTPTNTKAVPTANIFAPVPLLPPIQETANATSTQLENKDPVSRTEPENNDTLFAINAEVKKSPRSININVAENPVSSQDFETKVSQKQSVPEIVPASVEEIPIDSILNSKGHGSFGERVSPTRALEKQSPKKELPAHISPLPTWSASPEISESLIPIPSKHAVRMGSIDFNVEFGDEVDFGLSNSKNLLKKLSKTEKKNPDDDLDVGFSDDEVDLPF